MSVTTDEAAGLAQSMVRMTKMVAYLRQQTPRLHPDVEPAAFPLMLLLADEPKRVSAVAELLYADISTISRQASALVETGMVVKRPDPQDRRAAVLSLTPAGSELLDQFREQRAAWFQRILDGWQPEEVRRFRAELDRFTASAEDRLDELLRRPDDAAYRTTQTSAPA